VSVSMFIVENWSKFPVLVFVSSFLSVFEISSTSVANTDDVLGSSFLTLHQVSGNMDSRFLCMSNFHFNR
jgi:hypothetical protein